MGRVAPQRSLALFRHRDITGQAPKASAAAPTSLEATAELFERRRQRASLKGSSRRLSSWIGR